MDWILRWILGANGKASLTKAVGWLVALVGTLQTTMPNLIPHDLWMTIYGWLTMLGLVGVKNAIDKAAPVGSIAKPKA
jgi:hypothetical protein